MADVKIVVSASAVIAAGAIGWFFTRGKKPIKTAEEVAAVKTPLDQKQTFTNPYKDDGIVEMVHLSKKMDPEKVEDSASNAVAKDPEVSTSEESSTVEETQTNTAPEMVGGVETAVAETPIDSAIVETAAEAVVIKTTAVKDVEKNSDPRSEFGQKLKDALDA
jgi:hypothetical protein